MRLIAPILNPSMFARAQTTRGRRPYGPLRRSERNEAYRYRHYHNLQGEAFLERLQRAWALGISNEPGI